MCSSDLHLKRNATAGMLHTGSSIGRAFEANDFAITDHLEEQRQKHDNSPERRSELRVKRAWGRTLHPSKTKCTSPALGGARTTGGTALREIR